jgi:hypothetical protein
MRLEFATAIFIAAGMTALGWFVVVVPVSEAIATACR